MGAKAKVKQLESNHQNLFQKTSFQYTHELESATLSSSGSTTSSSILDTSTVLEAAQTISVEIEMDKLLKKMINVIIENAGANRGCIAFYQNDELLIEADYDAASEIMKLQEKISVNESDEIPITIVRYTIKSRQPVILDHASKAGLFTNDPYIKRKKTKSVLCFPIIKQNRLIGILYLENNLNTGAFIPQRLQVIEILSSQIAISVENARLIENLKEKERLKQEMEIAERLQTSLCPKGIEFESLEIIAEMRTAVEVGGDYYDYIIDAEGKLWFAIGDVSGHGVTSGIIMLMVQTALNAFLSNSGYGSPKEVLNAVNKTVFRNIRHRLNEYYFMTICIMKYLGNGDFIYTGAHEFILIYRKSEHKCERIKVNGIFIGLIEDIGHAIQDLPFHLDKDDVMVLYTDGIIESKNHTGELFEPDGIEGILNLHHDKPVEEIKNMILEKAITWCNNSIVDDMTLIVVRQK